MWMFLGLSLLLLFSICNAQINNAGTLQNDNRLNKFVQLMDSVGLSPSLGETILAPTTDAWQAYLEQDIGNKYVHQADFFVHLRELLLWHLVTEGRLTFDEIFNGQRQFMESTKGNLTIYQSFNIPRVDNVPSSAFSERDIATTDGMVHVLDQVIVPPYLAVNIIEQLLDDYSSEFAFTTMANLALYVGLDDEIDAMYENGITFLVPPNRRFNRAEIDVPALLTDEMRNYTRDFVKCHMILDNYHESGVFAYNDELEQEQLLVTTQLGTSLWITTTGGSLRFQSTVVLLTDQVAKNGIFHVLNLPLYPPYASDFAEFTHVSTSWDTSDCFRFFRQILLSSEEISKMFDTTLTVFCPTRDAFAFFNNEDFNRLLEPKWIRHAKEFLFNHISAGALTRQELVNMAPSTITMLNGETYELRKSGTRPRIKNGPVQSRSEFGDLIAMDGYLHVIDEAITPTAVSRSVYDKARADPEFSLLIENIDFVDLTDLVDRDFPLTMLTPDNTAWRRVEVGVLDVGDIILRHIFPRLLFMDVLANETQVVAVNGIVHGVELRGENNEHLFVGGAYIYNGDILARNGVMHQIDRVIGLQYSTTQPSTSPAPTITPQPTMYVPPTAPVALPTGRVPIVLPPSQGPPTPSQQNDGNQPASSAASMSVVIANFIYLGMAWLAL